MARCTFPTSLLFSFGLLVLVCFPRSVMARWSAIAESKVSYTNDVTNFSAVRRLKFSEDPSQPTGLPTQLSDVIWDPSLEVLRSSSSTLGPNELSIKAHGFIYTNEAPRSSLLRRSSHFGYEGRKLRGIRRRRIIRSSTTATTACNSSRGSLLTHRSSSGTGTCPRDWHGQWGASGTDCSPWLVKDMGVQAVPNLRQVVGELLVAGFVAKTDGSNFALVLVEINAIS